MALDSSNSRTNSKSADLFRWPMAVEEHGRRLRRHFRPPFMGRPLPEVWPVAVEDSSRRRSRIVLRTFLPCSTRRMTTWTCSRTYWKIRTFPAAQSVATAGQRRMPVAAAPVTARRHPTRPPVRTPAVAGVAPLACPPRTPAPATTTSTLAGPARSGCTGTNLRRRCTRTTPSKTAASSC
uniref:(northern house mosquito) hypothetical protein n=2 Tax=Culex pipiens TaxID=7175 RepID=A0A8D8G8D6_CULPI